MTTQQKAVLRELLLCGPYAVMEEVLKSEPVEVVLGSMIEVCNDCDERREAERVARAREAYRTG